MHRIKLKSHVDRDGVLQVHLPEICDTEVEVVIFYQTSSSQSAESVKLPQFYGCIQDDSFVRHPANEQSERESLE